MAPPHRHSETVRRRHRRLMSAVRPTRDALLSHWVYQQITDLESLRTFMTSHVFAVWDFMTLLKTLQRQLTCVETPWFPPTDRNSARLINEIVLCEESDEVRPGVYMSHFELYLAAMQEIGADRTQIDRFLERLVNNLSPSEALADLDIPQGTRDYVQHTLETATLAPHQVAAAFLLGRESLISPMFKQLLSRPVINPTISAPISEHFRRARREIQRALGPRRLGLSRTPTTGTGPNALRLYLERHIQIDQDDHGPLAEQLLMNLCRKNPQLWEEARQTAQEALLARHRMWEGVAKRIVTGHREGWTPQRTTPVIELAFRRGKKGRTG